MEPKMYKETLNLFFNKLAILFNSFFPGMVILELFFKKGYFSNPPVDIFSFLLFLVWCGILSIPYNIVHPMSIEKFSDKLLRVASEKYNLTESDLEEAMNKDEEEWDDIIEEFNLVFTLIKLVLTYVVYKALLIIAFPSFLIFNIPDVIIQFITSLILTTIFSYPIGYIYSKGALLLIKNNINIK